MKNLKIIDPIFVDATLLRLLNVTEEMLDEILIHISYDHLCFKYKYRYTRTEIKVKETEIRLTKNKPKWQLL